MIVRGAAAAAFVPPTETPILLIALYLPIRSDNFMSLVHRSFKIGRRDPIVMEIDAHAVLEIHPDLHGVVCLDSVAHQTLLLAHCRQGNRFALVIMPDQIHPMWADVAERIA